MKNRTDKRACLYFAKWNVILILIRIVFNFLIMNRDVTIHT